MVLPGLAGIETKFAVAAATRGAPVNLKVSCRAGVTNSPSAVRGCRKTRRRLGVGALRWWLAAGWGRLARVPARSRRRGGLFQNSGFLKCARQLHAGVNQLDCTFPCQHNSRDNVSLAGWLGGRRFHSSKRTAQSSSRSVWPSKRHWLKELANVSRMSCRSSFGNWKLGRWAHWSAPQLPEVPASSWSRNAAD